MKVFDAEEKQRIRDAEEATFRRDAINRLVRIEAIARHAHGDIEDMDDIVMALHDKKPRRR